MKLIENPFSLLHLPFGVVNFGETPHVCVRLDDYAISLDMLRRKHLFKTLALEERHTRTDSLHPLLEMSHDELNTLREALVQILGRGDHLNVAGCMKTLEPYPEEDPKVRIPIQPRDFVDFYCSRHHAHRVGCLFRGPENALPEQYFDLPIGYHGRSSTIFGSGTPVARPQGIVKGDSPSLKPSERLDYELEVGFVLRGHRGPLSPDEAWDLIFGVVLVNDWSARDIQSFEYKPLGPFLGKSFATTIANWVTPIAALTDWCCPNEDSQHEVLPHLSESEHHHLDLPLTATLLTQAREEVEICSTNLKNLAWSAAQMVSHLSSNGTILSPGDLIATGTVSGPEQGSRACLLELTDGGKTPFVSGSVSRTFLQDGDAVVLLGGHQDLGLAPCRGQILPQRPTS